MLADLVRRHRRRAVTARRDGARGSSSSAAASAGSPRRTARSSWRAARGCPLELTLLEARDRLGGTIETERADGFVVEARSRLLPLREAVGPGALPPARRRGSARAHRRSLPADLRRGAAGACTRCPTASSCWRRRSSGRSSGRGSSRGPASSAWPSTSALPRGGDARERREPRLLRAAPARARGAGAGRPAAGRRHLHGRSRRSEPGRHDAALPRAGAPRAERHPRAVAGGPPGAAGRARAARAGASS